MMKQDIILMEFIFTKHKEIIKEMPHFLRSFDK